MSWLARTVGRSLGLRQQLACSGLKPCGLNDAVLRVLVKGGSPANQSRFFLRRSLHQVAFTTLLAGRNTATMADGTGIVVVYVTVPDMATGEKLSEKLVESKLAACVNIIPGITSVYWWEGTVKKDAELLLMVKTRVTLLGELTTFVKANHPYKEPEVIAVPVVGGSPSYLDWVRTAVNPS